VTPPGINPGNIRPVAQHLNHNATPGKILDGNPPEIKTLEIQYKELNYYSYPRDKNVKWL
jgi:hypothetical protein